VHEVAKRPAAATSLVKLPAPSFAKIGNGAELALDNVVAKELAVNVGEALARLRRAKRVCAHF
jgi:hypothetical protein